jgi:hypothetical protein
MSREEEFISQNLNFLSRLDEFMYGYTEFMIAVDGDTFFKYFYRATQIYESDAKQWSTGNRYGRVPDYIMKGRKRGADSIFAKSENTKGNITLTPVPEPSEYDLAHHLWNKYVTTYDRDYGRFFRGMDTSNRMKVLIAMLLWYADHRATYSKDPYYAAIYSLIGAI